MAEGTVFLALAYVAIIGVIAGWTWRMLNRMVEMSGRLEAIEAALDDNEPEQRIESTFVNIDRVGDTILHDSVMIDSKVEEE